MEREQGVASFEVSQPEEELAPAPSPAPKCVGSLLSAGSQLQCKLRVRTANEDTANDCRAEWAGSFAVPPNCRKWRWLGRGCCAPCAVRERRPLRRIGGVGLLNMAQKNWKLREFAVGGAGSASVCTLPLVWRPCRRVRGTRLLSQLPRPEPVRTHPGHGRGGPQGQPLGRGQPQLAHSKRACAKRGSSWHPAGEEM